MDFWCGQRAEAFQFRFITQVSPIPEKNNPDLQLSTLVRNRLTNPKLSVTLEESRIILMECVKKGEAQAQKATGKDVWITVGNTGPWNVFRNIVVNSGA
jgi:chromosome condensin MukBEF complex kleisin-like MukF subunit